MRIGIGLPTYMREISLEDTLEWARRAEAHGFSSIATLDRLVYASHDPLIVLSAAAAVTRQIRLMTSVLITPFRTTAVLAKQVASLDNLSRGRVVLGVGLGGRAEDYSAAASYTHARGARLSQQIAEMQRIWAGEVRGFAGAIGPAPFRDGGPQVLVGGEHPAALRRIARSAHGWVARAGSADSFRTNAPRVDAAWQAAGRPGAPYKVALTAFGLGANAESETRRILGDYYAYVGEHAERIARSALLSVEAICATAREFESAGCDELLFFPALPDPGQVDLLAQTLKSRRTQP
jgi:alkanesulfonate monooxygenase SsuD/methylene tetrahydromethanopterin reductase-like flavin-dependent oxidoreductase (luciferase family)